MDERDGQDPLRDLGQRLDRARRAREHNAPSSRGGAGIPQGALGLALRIGIELVVAVIVGLGLGWLFDYELGTRPWGVIVFFFLGVAAGMVNVWRAVVGMGSAIGYRRQQPPPAAPQQKGTDWDDED